MARFIREWVEARFGAALADAVRVQYGGSVTARNAEAFLRLPDVDGALVGGASLDVEQFSQIVRLAGEVGRSEHGVTAVDSR